MKSKLKNFILILIILNFSNNYSKVFANYEVKSVSDRKVISQDVTKINREEVKPIKATPEVVPAQITSSSKVTFAQNKKVQKKAVSKIIVPPQLDTNYVKQRICEVFRSNCHDALTIAFHESGYRTNAMSIPNNPAISDYGVFQINCRWQKRRVGGNCNLFFDLETNLRIAKQIYDEQGWRPWATRIFLKR